MSYYINCSIPGIEDEWQLDDEEHIDEKEILENIPDWISDLAYEALNSCHVIPKAVFNEEEITEYYLKQAYDYILSKRDEWYITLLEKDDLNQIISSKRIYIDSLVKSHIEEEAGDGTFCSHVGKYVQDCTLAYCKQSRWHIEEDRMWFAPDGIIPQKPWIIDSTTTDYELGFWFTQDTWELMEYIGDFDEIFLIWYCAECGFCPPDPDEITSCCPVKFELGDTVQSLLLKCESHIHNDPKE